MVVPAPSSLLSMLPPKTRGSFDDSRPQCSGGATPKLPKNGSSAQILAPWHARQVVCPVERHVQPPQLREVLGQGAPQRDLQVPAPVLAQLDLVDADLEHVAGLGAFDRRSVR